MYDTFNTSDMSGAAKIFITKSDIDNLYKNHIEYGLTSRFLDYAIKEDYVDVDMFITMATVPDSDISKVEQYIGDSFSVKYHGRSPIIVSFSAVLFDDSRQIQKYRILKLYQSLFRLSSVARYGIVPNFEFAKCVVQGAMMDMSFSETSLIQDRISLNFNVLLMNYSIFNTLNSGSIIACVDFHGDFA